ncbi:MAG: hypothetical protein U0166_17900 [Acidobacteriota bacterium]
MAIEKSEKNFLERVADSIPGIKGYRAREERRDTDKRLRDYLAGAIDTSRRGLTDAKLDLTKAGKLDLLDRVDRSERKMQRIADAVRHASYGYSGFFDQLKIGENELDRLYAHDTSMVALCAELEARATAVRGAEPAVALDGLEAAVEALDRAFQDRKTLFDKPEGGV